MRLRQPSSLATPVRSSRQWITGLSPNAAGDGWNYIVDYIGNANPHQWTVLKNFTTDPVETQYETLQSIYPNTTYGLGTGKGQIRAQNGRLFFLQVKGYTTYYDPTDEQVHQIGPIVEDPPIDPNASTIFYSASFDTAGLLYFATQESESRPSCVVVTDTDTLEQTVIGYVGENANAYTTYGYYIAPDTGTATKYVYVAYGQDPWQLWALNVTTGTATKLHEVTSAGSISFTNITDKGWRVTFHTNLGQPDDVTTFKWCIDGALEDYTVGVDPSSPRNVTPASNPLVSPPEIDTSRGAGQMLWRPNGSSGDWTLIKYTINHPDDVDIESLLPLSDGTVFGNAEQYQGFFRYHPSTNTADWYGNWTGGVSQSVLVEAGDYVYICGYPNAVLYRYDPTQDWDTSSNPELLGYFGSTLADTLYAYCLEYSAANNRLYMLGRRERTGTGSGVAYHDIDTNTRTGTNTDLSNYNPRGMVILPEIQRVVIAGLALDGTDGVLVAYDYDLTETDRWTLDGWTDAGKLFAVGNGIIVGVSATEQVAYRFDVRSGTLGTWKELGDTVGVSAQSGNEIVVRVGSAMKSLDVATLNLSDSFTAHPGADVLSLGRVMYYSDGPTLYQHSIVSQNGGGRGRRARRDRPNAQVTYYPLSRWRF